MTIPTIRKDKDGCERSIGGSVELRQGPDGRKRISGYAAVFDSESQDLGGYREVIRRGAFDRALAKNPDVSCRVQHEGGLTTIGRTSNGTLTIAVDTKGLSYSDIPPDTNAGRDIQELVRTKYINKSSFAFYLAPGGDRWDQTRTPPLREILSIDTLVDVAPVDGPAYEATSVEARARSRRGVGSGDLSVDEVIDRELRAYGIVPGRPQYLTTRTFPPDPVKNSLWFRRWKALERSLRNEQSLDGMTDSEIAGLITAELHEAELDCLRETYGDGSGDPSAVRFREEAEARAELKAELEEMDRAANPRAGWSHEKCVRTDNTIAAEARDCMRRFVHGH